MGKPGRGDARSPVPEQWYRASGGTGGTETSQYLQEEKTNSDSLSSGERTGSRLNRVRGRVGRRCVPGVVGVCGVCAAAQARVPDGEPKVLEGTGAVGETPVGEHGRVGVHACPE